MGDDWHQTDACHESFKGRVKNGWVYQNVVADYLDTLGLSVTRGGLYIREHASTDPFDDGGDLMCEGMDVEVKSTRFPFTTPNDFKFPAPMVDSVASFENSKRNKHPVAYIVVSSQNGGMMYLPVDETRAYWIRVNKRDMNLDRRSGFYQCEKKYWRTMESFRTFIAWKKAGGKVYNISL